MKQLLRKSWLLLFTLGLLWPLAARAEVDPINSTTFGDLAVDGYDPVAYFTDGKPVEGKKEFSFDWSGATWRFASAEHRDLFAAAREVAEAEGVSESGYRLLFNTGPDSGQVIFHAHLHLLGGEKLSAERV